MHKLQVVHLPTALWAREENEATELLARMLYSPLNHAKAKLLQALEKSVIFVEGVKVIEVRHCLSPISDTYQAFHREMNHEYLP